MRETTYPHASRRADSPTGVSRRSALRGGLGLLALSGLPALAACAPKAGHQAAPEPSPGPLHPVSDGQARQVIALSQVDTADVVAGMRSFGAALYAAAASTTSNFTSSPMSIDVAFGMLRAGARGTTARQIDHVFGFAEGTAPQGSPHAALNALTAHLTTDQPVSAAPKASKGQPPPPIVAIANGLFVDRSYQSQIRRAFLQVLATQYGASPQSVSFATASAAATINAWVTRQTRGRITRLFDQLDPSTRLVLANAVYLKAAWLEPFSAGLTKSGDFTTAEGHQVEAHLMSQFASVGYTAGPGWQRVSLPYAGGDLVMRIVVPTAPARTIATLARSLAAATAPGRADRFAQVHLTLPRWNTATTLPLVRELSQLGMADAFGDHADLSGIATGLFVSDAIHRANITVDENGTEAAAVTGIGIGSSAIAGPPITVRADRPFAWAIVHEPTGTPIFTGHVVDPTR